MLRIWLLHNNIKYIKIISNINKLLFQIGLFRTIKMDKMFKRVEYHRIWNLDLKVTRFLFVSTELSR